MQKLIIKKIIILSLLLSTLFISLIFISRQISLRSNAFSISQLEPENGVLAGNISAVNDASVSNGKYIQFSSYGPQPNITCAVVTPSPVIVNTNDDLQTKINANANNTTFCLKTGIHRMTTMVLAKEGDTFIGESGAIINGSTDISNAFTQSGAIWVASNMTMESPPAPPLAQTSPEPCNPPGPLCRYNEDVYINDSLLQRVGSVAEVTAGAFFFDYPNDKIYIGDNPAGKKVEVATANKFMKGRQSGLGNVPVKNLIIEKFATPFQQAALEARGLAENNEIRFNHSTGLLDGTVKNNFIHHNGELGLGGGAILVEHNEISYNNTAGFNYGNEGGGSKWVQTNGLTVKNNYVHDNRGPGLWTDGNNINTTYENNRVEYNRGVGIFDEINFGAIIRNNIVRFNNLDKVDQPLHQGGNIHLNTAQSTEIYGNFVEASPGTNGISMYGTNRGTSTFGQFTGRAFEMKNISVHDNTIKQNGGKTGARSGLYDVSSLNIHFSNNIYYLDDLTAQRFDWNGFKTKDEWIAAPISNDTTGTFLKL